MKRLLAVVLGLISCGHHSEMPTTGSGSGSGTTTEAAVAPRWPIPPAPALPPALADLHWPMTYDEVNAKWPALASPDGMRADDMVLRLQPGLSPANGQIWIEQPSVDLGKLEDAWGPLKRDHDGQALWWDPKHGVKARYDINRHGIELSYYAPALDVISAAPDALLPGAKTLLGNSVDALDSYQHLIAERTDKLAQIWLPAGEWDPSQVTVVVGFKNGRIAEMTMSLRIDGSPVDEAAVRERLAARWGTPTQKGDVTSWHKDRVHVELTTNTSKLLPLAQLHYQVK